MEFTGTHVRCNNCGELVERGIMNVDDHVWNKCTNFTTEPFEFGVITRRPPMSFSSQPELSINQPQGAKKTT